MAGQSLLTVAGWWVAWVYALSLSLSVLLSSLPIPGPTLDEIFQRWAREVKFKSSGMVVSQADPAGLATLTAVATSPAPVAGPVEVFVEEMTAKDGVDFEQAKRGVKIHFEKGAVEGTLRSQPGWGPDIRIVSLGQWKEPRSFRLWLQDGPDAVAAGDRAMCLVTIDDGPMPPPKAGLIPVGFARDSMPLPLKDLATTPFEVTAATAVAEPVPVKFGLFHTRDGVRRPLGRFERTLATGDRRTAFRLADFFTPEQLEKFGLTDTGLPGIDQTYEIDLMAPPPLFPDTGSRTCRIVAENTNQPPKVKPLYFDAQKREVAYVDWQGFATLEYDRPMRNDSEHEFWIAGRRIGTVTVPAGSRRGNLLPLGSLGDGQGTPEFDNNGGSGGNKKSKDDRDGQSDPEVTDPERNSPEPGPVNVLAKPGKGCGDGQDGYDGTSCFGKPIAGDYMLIVVNNERLHDPNDGIVAEVKRALADESAKPYGNGAIILNPDDEDSLTPTSGGPDPKKMFQPYNKEGHDVAGQLKRIEEVVARKRKAAANPDLRAVVVWPERDLAAGTGVRPVAGADLQPMSFLLPDAAASYARTVERGLMPPGPPSRNLTVRAPRERELQAHLVNVIAEGNAAGDASEP